MRTKIISKEELIQTAECIIRDEGLGKCSIRRIARDKEVAVGTIYNYYGSRDELLMDVFNVSWNRTLDSIKEAFKINSSTIQKINTMVEILEEDVKNRNGLGKEIVSFKGNLNIKNQVDLKERLIELLSLVIDQDMHNMDKSYSIARWIVLMIFDCIIYGRKISRFDLEVIESLILL